MENALQEEVFHHTRLLRSEASMAENAYNRLLTRETPSYRDRSQLYELMNTTEGLHRSAQDLYEDANVLTDTIEDLETVEEHLGQEFENAYDAMDFIEGTPSLGNPLDAVYTEPLEIISEDYATLKTRIVSWEGYRDIKQEMESNEANEKRRELQQDADMAAEKLGFASSQLEVLFERSNDHNMEAAEPLFEEYGSRTFHHHKYGIGLLKDVHQYRREHGLIDQGNCADLINERSTRTPERHVEGVRDVDTEPLNQAMGESAEVLTDLSKLPLEEGPWENLGKDETEVLDDSEVFDQDRQK